MYNLADIVRDIRNQATSDDISELIAAVKYRQSQLCRSVSRAVRCGDTVEFEGRYGNTVTGVVVKVNPKTLVVKEGNTKWRVTASLCKVVETA